MSEYIIVMYLTGMCASLLTIGFLATEDYWKEPIMGFVITAIAALLWPMVSLLAIGANIRRIKEGRSNG